MKLYEHLESEQARIYEKTHLIIYNIKCLCDHGGLHTMKSRKGQIYPRKCTQSNESNIYKNGEMGVCSGHIQVKTLLI